jgi:hypothetical protein
MALSSWIFPALAASALLASTSPAGAQPLLHHNRDDAERAELRTTHPDSADLLDRAEPLIRAGKLSEAEPLLAQAATAAPVSFIVARRRCQVLTELGRRSSAIEACNVALKGGHMAMDRLATVAALMTGPAAPSSDRLAEAVTLAITAKNLTGQPFGDAALCEIAYRVGDAQLLKDCAAELNRIAPNHYLTKRWGAVASERSGAAHWLVWLAFAGAALATLAHALRSRQSAKRALGGAPVAAALFAACLLLQPKIALAQAPAEAPAASAGDSASPAPAQQPRHMKKDGHWQLSRFPINYDNPEATIPTEAERNKEPLDFGYYLQDLASEGAYAEKSGDYAGAVKFWRALAKAVPDVATGFRRSCAAYEVLKDRYHGLDFCGSTLNQQGAVLEDYVHYGNVMLMKPEHLDAAELSDLENTIKHLRGQGGDGPLFIAETLTCELGVHEQDVKRLEPCTQALVKLKPNEPQTLSFLWSLAMFRHDYAAAQDYVDRLKTTSYNPALVARMAASVQSEKRWWKPFLSDWRYQASLLTVLLAAGVGLLSSRKKSSTSSPPTTAAPGVT